MFWLLLLFYSVMGTGKLVSLLLLLLLFSLSGQGAELYQSSFRRKGGRKKEEDETNRASRMTISVQISISNYF